MGDWASSQNWRWIANIYAGLEEDGSGLARTNQAERAWGAASEGVSKLPRRVSASTPPNGLLRLELDTEDVWAPQKRRPTAITWWGDASAEPKHPRDRISTKSQFGHGDLWQYTVLLHRRSRHGFGGGSMLTRSPSLSFLSRAAWSIRSATASAWPESTIFCANSSASSNLPWSK